MELGGHAPMIVFPEVDLEDAVAGAVAAKFQTSGQDCLAANRIYVHASIYERFVERFAAYVKELRVGNGLEEGVEIGPLMHERAVEKCAGARRAMRGQGRPGADRWRAAGRLLLRADRDRRRDRRHGDRNRGDLRAGRGGVPLRVRGRGGRASNDTIYGLAAYLWSNDLNRVARVSAALEYGMVAVNCVKMTGAPIPFGGVKQSGLGREGSRHGLEEFTELKYVCIAIAEAA